MNIIMNKIIILFGAFLVLILLHTMLEAKILSIIDKFINGHIIKEAYINYPIKSIQKKKMTNQDYDEIEEELIELDTSLDSVLSFLKIKKAEILNKKKEVNNKISNSQKKSSKASNNIDKYESKLEIDHSTPKSNRVGYKRSSNQNNPIINSNNLYKRDESDSKSFYDESLLEEPEIEPNRDDKLFEDVQRSRNQIEDNGELEEKEFSEGKLFRLVPVTNDDLVGNELQIMAK